jgi:hypothetical protein
MKLRPQYVTIFSTDFYSAGKAVTELKHYSVKACVGSGGKAPYTV